MTIALKQQLDEDIELFKKYQTTKKLDENGKVLASDLKLRNELAKRNAKLVTFVINKFFSKKQKHKELRADLLQEGHLGLFDAIDGFKPELGFKFSTYATWWIRQSVHSYLLDREPMLHVPSHVRTAKNKLYNAIKEKSMSFQDVDKKMLNEIGMTEKMFASVNATLKTKDYNFQSLDEPVSSSVDKPLKELISDNEVELNVLIDNKKIITAAKTAFNKLPLREKCVLLERYGVDCSTIYMNGDKK